MIRAPVFGLALSGCAAVAPPVVAPAPVVAVARLEQPARVPEVVVQQAVVVVKEHKLVAEAGRYVAWKQSKAPIISRLTVLTTNARRAVAILQAQKTVAGKLAALPVAEDAVAALQQYLQTKGD